MRRMGFLEVWPTTRGNDGMCLLVIMSHSRVGFLSREDLMTDRVRHAQMAAISGEV
jgi:hypothetical protein